MKKVLKYVGVDDWHNNRYEDEDGRVYVDLSASSDPRKPGDLHTVTPDYEEPDRPVHFGEIEVTGWTDLDQLQRNFRHEYMMLSALKMKSYDPVSFGYTPQEIADEMLRYYDMLPVKPVWCSREYIESVRTNKDNA